MKKILLITLVIISSLVLFGCKGNSAKEYKVIFTAGTGGYISGLKNQVVFAGGTSDVVKAIPDEGYEFVRWSDNVKDDKRIIENVSEDIALVATFRKIVYEYPNIFIDTEGQQKITSRVNYVNCSVTVDDNKNPEYDLYRVDAKIRGRGNSTWDKPKKPYRLKFNEKVDLFGNGANKDWTLIANYVDPSLIRNYLAFSIGAKMDDLSFTTQTQFAALYLNGEYQGLYLVCEQIEVGKNRVEIDDSLEGNISFLIELDGKIYEEEGEKIEGLDYFFVEKQPYSIKAPKTDKNGFTKNDCTRIQNYIQMVLDTVKNGPFVYVEAMIDVDSFVDGYIIHELFSNVDVNLASWYLYKDKEGKVTNSPIWDFDISAGNVDYNEEARVYNTLFAKKNTWYKYLLKYPEFNDLVKEKLNHYYEMIRFTIDEAIDEVMHYSSFFEDNFKKWKILGKYSWPNPKELVAIKTWEGHVEFVREWLFNKLEYMKKMYCDN